jgi:predicted enzyme related to lactoylglutathione lyase
MEVSMSNHPIVHIEFSSTDREAAAKFYSELFGWKVEQIPQMNYATFDDGRGLGGGFNPVTEGNPPGTVCVYIQSDDIEADLAKAEKLGGKTIQHKMEIPMTGWFGLFADPTGNTVGLYTDMPHSS